MMRFFSKRFELAIPFDKEFDHLTKMGLPVPSRRVNRLLGALLLCVMGWYFWTTNVIAPQGPMPLEVSIADMDVGTFNTTNRLPLIPAKIWQIYLSFTPDTVPTQFLDTWIRNSPSYLYGILDAGGAYSLVEKLSRTPKYNSVIPLYYAMSRRVLRADFLRYLTLAIEGGLYSDMDTRLLKPMYEWVPAEFRDKTALIVGIEADEDPPVVGTTYPVQFCQWTLASAPGHPALWSMIDRILERIQSRPFTGPPGAVDYTDGDVLDITGPAGWTEIVFQHISKQVGYEVDWRNLTGIREPVLFGDTLVLPIDAFATGVPHSGASKDPGPGSMVIHHFNGGWRDGGG